MLGGHGAEVALARAHAQGRQADRQAEPRDGRERPGVLGEVLPLLGRRAAAGADGGRALPPRRRRRRSRTATRTRSASSRSSARPSTAATSRSRRSPRRSTSSRQTAASTSRSTSTPPRAGSSRRSSSRTSSGTSACRACSRSTPPATSTGSSTPASAGRSGATRRRCPQELDLRRQLPRRPHADVRAELLAAGQRGDRAVLHVHQPRPRGLPADACRAAQDVAHHLAHADRRDRARTS